LKIQLPEPENYFPAPINNVPLEVDQIPVRVNLTSSFINGPSIPLIDAH